MSKEEINLTGSQQDVSDLILLKLIKLIVQVESTQLRDEEFKITPWLVA